MKYEVYKITNKINGKIYIGRTYKDYLKRFRYHINQAKRGKLGGKTYYLHNAMNKHGYENFYVELLYSFNSFQEMKDKEAEMIQKLDSINPKIGYNLIVHSYNSEEAALSESSRRKLSLALHKAKRKGEHGYGVYRDNLRGRYEAYIMHEHKKRSKIYNDLFEAQIAYDKMACFFYGKDAVLNFPENMNVYLSSDLKAFYDYFTFREKTESGYINVRAFENGTFQGRARNAKLNVGVYSTAEEAALAYDIVTFYDTKSYQYINFKEQISKMSPKEIEEKAKYLIENGKNISVFRPAKNVVYDVKNRLYIANFLTKSGDKERCKNGKFNNLEDAKILSDRVNFYLNRDFSAINDPQNVKGLTELELEKLFMQARGTSRIPAKKTSKYKGISKNKRGSFTSVCSFNNKAKNLGTYSSEEEAAEAHDKFLIYTKGDMSKLLLPHKLNEYKAEDLELFYNKVINGLKPINKKTSSQYRGVYRRKDTGMWSFAYRIGNKRIRKDFKTETEAAKAYDEYAFRHLGKLAKLNFPSEAHDIERRIINTDILNELAAAKN